MGKYFVPEELVSKIRTVGAEGITLLRNGRYTEAEQKLREELDEFQQWETKNNRRVHKGHPFHNLGLSLLYQGASQDALTFLFFLLILKI